MQIRTGGQCPPLEMADDEGCLVFVEFCQDSLFKLRNGDVHKTLDVGEGKFICFTHIEQKNIIGFVIKNGLELADRDEGKGQ